MSPGCHTGTEENLRGRNGWAEKDMGVPWVTLARIGQLVSLPISAINWRAETQATHSPGPGEVLGLIQCPCDRGSACPITRLPCYSSPQWPLIRPGRGRGGKLLPLPLSRSQLCFMHSELILFWKIWCSLSNPQVSQYLTHRIPDRGIRQLLPIPVQ